MILTNSNNDNENNYNNKDRTRHNRGPNKDFGFYSRIVVRGGGGGKNFGHSQMYKRLPSTEASAKKAKSCRTSWGRFNSIMNGLLKG